MIDLKGGGEAARNDDNNRKSCSRSVCQVTPQTTTESVSFRFCDREWTVLWCPHLFSLHMNEMSNSNLSRQAVSLTPFVMVVVSTYSRFHVHPFHTCSKLAFVISFFGKMQMTKRKKCLSLD